MTNFIWANPVQSDSVYSDFKKYFTSERIDSYPNASDVFSKAYDDILSDFNHQIENSGFKSDIIEKINLAKEAAFATVKRYFNSVLGTYNMGALTDSLLLSMYVSVECYVNPKDGRYAYTITLPNPLDEIGGQMIQAHPVSMISKDELKKQFNISWPYGHDPNVKNLGDPNHFGFEILPNTDISCQKVNTFFNITAKSTDNGGIDIVKDVPVLDNADTNMFMESFGYSSNVSNIVNSVNIGTAMGCKITASFSSLGNSVLEPVQQDTYLSEISGCPDINISDLGFFSVWNPTFGQLKTLSKMIWNDPTNYQEWPEIFRSGIIKFSDYIISLALYPITSDILSTNLETFVMGGIVFDGRLTALGLNIQMNKVQKQFVDIDMGTISLKEHFKNYLDYAPYTTCSLYLPFYQTVEIPINEIQNCDSIHLVYRLNILDGTCAIKVHLTKAQSESNPVEVKHTSYEYFTNLKSEISLTAGNNTEQLKMLATLAAGATALIAAPMAGAGAAALAGSAGLSAGAASMIGTTTSSLITSGVNNIANSLPNGGGVQRGNIGSMSNGLCSERRPFLIINRPIQLLPENYSELTGFNSFKTSTVGDLTGFAKFSDIHVDNIDNALTQEKEMIENLLKAGIMI